MSNEIDYKILSEHVYWLDKKHEGYDPSIKEAGKIKGKGIEYQILKTENSIINGMQAMAVSPFKNGKVDTSEVVIAYAGTNLSDGADIQTDIQTVIGGNKDVLNKPNGHPGYGGSISVEDSQISTAEKFAGEVKAKYPQANITTTGHSLGEYIALYIAAENEWGNVGFNGPDPYDILSPEAQQWVEANSGMLFNYRNNKDTIGNYGGNGTGAEIRVDMDTKRY